MKFKQINNLQPAGKQALEVASRLQVVPAGRSLDVMFLPGTLRDLLTEPMGEKYIMQNQYLIGIGCLAILMLAPGAVLADEADRFFDDSFVHEIHMTFEDGNWYNDLYSAYMMGDDEYYLPCIWEYTDAQGSITVNPVGARFKGHSSFFDSGPKKSFKIDFNELDSELSFLGLKKLNLNNNFRDPTMLREKLFLDFLGSRTIAHRAVFVRVLINGELWGVFTAAEQVDGSFCKRVFGDVENGNLYKGEFQADLTYHGDDQENYYSYYELKTNETENDWSGLVSLIGTLNHATSETITEILPEIFDYDSFLQHFAANILFVNLDSYLGPAHNYYLYHRDHDGRFVHLIWDCNMAFGNYTSPFPQGYDMTEVPLLWRDNQTTGRPLSDQPWGSEMPVRDHYRTLAEMVRTDFNPDYFNQRIDELADTIRADVYTDPKKDYTNEEFEQGMTTGVDGIVGLKHFVADRRTFVEAALNDQALPSDLHLNEIMTVNMRTITDESGDYDPWMEIYNLGPGLVHTTSYFLTDDDAEPGKWMIPDITIDDGEFGILWLDGEPQEGSKHASFRAGAEGGELYLYYHDGQHYQLIDSVVYAAMNADFTWGRWPDGTGGWTVLRSPTAGSENDLPYQPEFNLLINEFMASNTSAYRDETGEYEDWLEIYNSGVDPVDMTGMYLTDDPDNPGKWSVPSLVIQPGHWIVFICDEDQEQGDRHTNFKLAQGGESIGLYHSDGVTPIDTVTYTGQTTDVSFGRCPDGSSGWAFLYGSTPGASNNSACPGDGMHLILEDTDLMQGDRFNLHFTLVASQPAAMDAYVLLDVQGYYWSWPTWIPITEGIGYQTYTVQPGQNPDIEVFDFTWPEVQGSLNSLFFYGAAFQEDTFDTIGDIQIVEFGYR